MNFSGEDFIGYGRNYFPTGAEGEHDIIYESNAPYETNSDKEQHLLYLKTRFIISCSKEIFSDKELELLEKYGAWLEALYLHKINPITQEQTDFIENMNKSTLPENELAKVWYKYIKRLEIEERYGNKLNARYKIVEDDFYRREDYYKFHKDKKRKL